MAGNDRFTLRNIYLYGVCFVTLLIAIFAAVNLIRSAVELAYPAPSFYPAPLLPDDRNVDQEEWERQERLARDSQQREAVLGLVGSGALLLITGPTYVYHWRQIQTERPAARREPDAAGSPDASDG
jgi:hypothetical protein